jgi:hypothetical protein
MESAQALAAKRRVLVDALMMCLSRSRVVSVVDAKTVRGVLDSAASELWREGEFRLEPVWKMLVTQPGLSAEDVAPPLLVFKAFEKQLGVQVRVPQALSAIPRGEQIKLRDALGINRDDFAKAMEELRGITGEDQSPKDAAAQADEAAPADRPVTSRAQKVPPPRKRRPVVVALLALLALGGVSLGAWYGLRDSSAAFDVSDVAGTIQLGKARLAQGSMSATITDPRWDGLPKDEQKRLAQQLLEQEAPKGIHTITLSDEKGATRALVSEGPNGPSVVIP